MAIQSETKQMLQEKAYSTLLRVADELAESKAFKGFWRQDPYNAVAFQRFYPHMSGLNIMRMVTISVTSECWTVRDIGITKTQRRTVLSVLAAHGVTGVIWATGEGKQYGLTYKKLANGQLMWRYTKPHLIMCATYHK